jgi:hypothetical protein
MKDEVIINKSENMEVVINGIVYVPKEKDKELESVILEEHFKFEVHPKELGAMNWEEANTECALLGEGWRLPTRGELLLMYENKTVVGGFANNYYWSSTESDFSYAWYFTFDLGSADNLNKGNTSYVRAVRSLKNK